jgi:hypothetical protein
MLVDALIVLRPLVVALLFRFRAPRDDRPTRWALKLLPGTSPPSSDLLELVGEMTFFAREKALELLRRAVPRALPGPSRAAPYPRRSKGFCAALVRPSAPLGEPIAKRPVSS